MGRRGTSDQQKLCIEGMMMGKKTLSACVLMSQCMSCGGENRMGLCFEERVKRMSSPQTRVKWKGQCWQVLEISNVLSAEPMLHGTQC